MELIILCPETGKQIATPEGCACPRVGETVRIEGNENYTVKKVTHDYLAEVTWIYLSA